MKYFCNLLHEMGPRGPTKGNALLTRKNVFLQKETSHCKNSLALGPQGQFVFGKCQKAQMPYILVFYTRKHFSSKTGRQK